MLLSEHVIEVATRMLCTIPELSGDLKVFWTSLLKATALEDLTDSQIEQRQIMGASQPFKTPGELEKNFLSMPDDEQRQIIACLNITAREAKRIKDRASVKAIDQLLSRLPQLDTTEMEATFAQRLDGFNNRKHFVVNGNIRLLSVDFALKWCVLITVAATGLNIAWTMIGAQIISIISIVVGWWMSRRDRKANVLMLKELSLKYQWTIAIHYSRFQYLVLAAYVICSSIIVFVIVAERDLIALVTLFLIVCLYYYIMLMIFPIGKLTPDDLAAQLQETDEFQEIGADENDEAIVRLRTQLESHTSRLEAYVLESALFGALAFSGFLQIIATDLISFDDLENFGTAVFHSLHGILTGQVEELRQYAASLNTKESLFCLVSIETLVCSGLFLAVIASRLRFSNVADSIRTSLSLASVYNEKEEAILLENSAELTTKRFTEINAKVSQHIRVAVAQFKNIAPVVGYMEYLRHAGILVFLLVLVTTCLFVSAFLSWTFLVAAIATGIYFNNKSLRKNWTHNLFSFKVFFAAHSWALFLGTVAVGVIGFAIRLGFNSNFTDVFLLISVFSLGILLCVWLVMMPHVDTKFGDIENLKSEHWRSSRYKVVKTVYGLSVLATIFGLSLKITGTFGADELLSVGLTLTALTSYALGYYLSRPKWLGIFCGFLIGTSAMGTLFKTLHMAGGEEMLQMATWSQIIFFVVYFIKRRSFHYILLRVAAGMAILTLIVSGHTSYIRKISLMYDHGSTDLVTLANYFYQVPFAEPQLDYATVTNATAQCDEYFSKYDVRQRSTNIHRRWAFFFNNVARNHLFIAQGVVTTDSARLRIADVASAQLEKISEHFGYEGGNPLLRPQLLAALRRKNEALASIERYLNRYPDKKHAEEVQDLYAQISHLPDSAVVEPVVTDASMK